MLPASRICKNDLLRPDHSEDVASVASSLRPESILDQLKKLLAFKFCNKHYLSVGFSTRLKYNYNKNN